jgi:dienelactone hydrolase
VTIPGAQARVLAALAASSGRSLPRRAACAATRAPSLLEVELAGMQATLARPARGGPWPAAVFVNGVTARGRAHPAVRALACALARVGLLVLVPDPAGLARGELGPATVDAVTSAALAVARRPDCRDGRVGLLGVSVGATLALLVAEDPALAARVSIVAGLAPAAWFRNVVMLATTGHHRDAVDGRVRAYATPPFLLLVVARSLVAGLEPSAERERLRAALAGVDEDDPDPLAALDHLPAPSSAEAHAVLGVLRNRDPDRFTALDAALPERFSAACERLSPCPGVGRIRAPVELVTGPADRYVPRSELRALERASSRVRVTETATLAHATADLSLAGIADLARLDAYCVRVMQALSSPTPA